VIRSGGRVMKNVTGYDFVKLAAGSFGTLGVLTELTFKVLPRPETETTLVLRGLDDARAVAALSAALGSPYDVGGAAHLPGVLGADARTLVRLEGFGFSVEHRAAALARTLARFGTAERLEPAASAELWRGVRDVLPLVEPREQAIWSISTAPTHGPRLVAALPGVARAWLYDWGGGLVWLAAEAVEDCGAAAIRTALRPLGGHATLVRAPDDVRAALPVFEPPAPAVLRLSAALKASFDPAGVLNPGRMYAGT
jgi:glycolate oxidase FAD binding subunit